MIKVKKVFIGIISIIILVIVILIIFKAYKNNEDDKYFDLHATFPFDKNWKMIKDWNRIWEYRDFAYFFKENLLYELLNKDISVWRTKRYYTKNFLKKYNSIEDIVGEKNLKYEIPSNPEIRFEGFEDPSNRYFFVVYKDDGMWGYSFDLVLDKDGYIDDFVFCEKKRMITETGEFPKEYARGFNEKNYEQILNVLCPSFFDELIGQGGGIMYKNHNHIREEYKLSKNFLDKYGMTKDCIEHDSPISEMYIDSTRESSWEDKVLYFYIIYNLQNKTVYYKLNFTLDESNELDSVEYSKK